MYSENCLFSDDIDCLLLLQANEELASLRLLIALGLLDRKRFSAVHFTHDNLLLIRAMRFCVRHVDVKRWEILVDIGTSFPSFETVLQEVCLLQ